MGGLRKSKFSQWRSDSYPLISLVLGGEVPRLNHGPICFPIQNLKGGATGCRKSSTTFFTLSRRIKVHLLLMYCIKNLSIGVSQGGLLNLFWIFEYVTSEPFCWVVKCRFPWCRKVETISVAMGILNCEPKMCRKVYKYVNLTHFFFFFFGWLFLTYGWSSNFRHWMGGG